jgi:hypothetical protein
MQKTLNSLFFTLNLNTTEATMLLLLTGILILTADVLRHPNFQQPSPAEIPAMNGMDINRRKEKEVGKYFCLWRKLIFKI